LTVQGARFSGDALTVSIVSPSLGAPVVVTPAPGWTDGSLSFVVPTGPQSLPGTTATQPFPAGLYSIGVTVTQNGTPFSSNALPIALGPTITSGLPATVSASAGAATLRLGCDPPLQLDQRVSLLLGGTPIPANPFGAPATSVSFTLRDIPAAVYLARLRVDGADSAVVADMTKIPPVFDPGKRLTVT
jgi:hypothetical protein